MQGGVTEQGSYAVDTLSQGFVSNIPGFLNVTIGASNINSLAASYATCQAPISFVNGKRVPTQPSASNGATSFTYSYTVSDNATYVVSANLTVSAASPFASVMDQLGNQFQPITALGGTRLYTHLATGVQLLSTITGLAPASAYLVASQRFYPYTLLSSAPGVYSMNSAPFLDGNGVQYTVSPPVPVNGQPVGSGAQFSSVRVFSLSTSGSTVLAEGSYVNPPLLALQQQRYSMKM